jgi:uncharacterized protein YggE
MKKIIMILFVITTALSFSDSSGFDKKVQVTGTATQTLTPDNASLYFYISTINDNFEKSGSENAEILDRFKSLLKKSNIAIDKFETTDYSTNNETYYDSVLVNEGQKEYVTTLDMEIAIDNLKDLKSIIDTLSKEGIDSFTHTKDRNYIFSLTGNDKDMTKSYQITLDKYKNIEKSLIALGVDKSKIRIANYYTDEKSLEKYDNVKKEKYTAVHSIKVTVKDLTKLGKLITIAQALGIQSSGYITYDFDNKQQLEDKLYENAYLEAQKKARLILEKTELSLQKPVTITDNSRGTIQPFTDYFYTNYYDFFRYDNIDNDEYSTNNPLKKSDTEIIQTADSYNLFISPRQLPVTKTVNIEFQMNLK